MMPLLALVGLAHAGSIHVDQARIFLRRHYYADAMAEVELGLADPATADALDLYAIGVDAAWELGEIDRVLSWSQQASDLALGGDAHDAWQGRHDTVAATWGWLRVAPRDGRGSSTRLQVEPATPVLDPEQKRIANVIALRAHDPTSLPARLALPTGDWLINGVAVTVTPGEVTPLALSAEQLGLAGLAALQTLRLDVSASAQVLAGAKVAGSGPTGALGLDLTGPLGRALLGGGVTWAPQAYVSAQGHRYASPWAGSANLHVGADLPVAGAIAFRPGVGLAAQLVEGLPVPCECGLGAPTTLYVPGWAVGPAAQVGVEWRQAGRSSATAFGVRVEGALGFGRTVSGGHATVDGNTLTWTSEPSPLAAGTVRIGAYIGL